MRNLVIRFGNLLLILVLVTLSCGGGRVTRPPSDEEPVARATAALPPAEPAATATPETPPTPEPPTSTPEPTPLPEPPTPTPQPQVLTGTGQQAAGPLTLNPGLVVATMTHSGESNFAVTVLDDQGQPVELLVNTIGSFEGSKAFHVDGGSYVLDIAAGGDWSVTLAQPDPPADLPGPPHSLSGPGQQATQFLGLNAGLATFKMTHQGEGNFAIILMDQNGQVVDLLVNEIGAFDGSKAAGIPSVGAYLLDITADGDWTVTIEQ